MAKLIILSVLIALTVMTEGFSFKKFINRRDPFPEPANPPAPRATVEGNITQNLDHFDPTNSATWTQRYLMNGDNFQEGGVIFVFLAGEWEITPYRLENSLMAELAQELNGYMFYLEHRYYGQSFPTADASDANLRFLTTEQALADVAHFVTHIRDNSVTPGARDSPIIVIGGHYSGSLAVWFRQKYPHLVTGAWASSAPLVSIVDHFQYKELSGAVYRHIGGDACYNRLERGFAQASQMIDDGLDDDVEEMFHLCGEIETEQDIQIFFATLSAFYSLLAQFDELVSIENVCEIFLGEHESDAHAIAELLDILLEDECVDISYERVLFEERQTAWDAPAVSYGLRQWSYQSCTQFVWYHSSNSRFQPFGNRFPAEFVYQACADVFGDNFNQTTLHANSGRFNTVYGGLNPSVTNTIFVHGQYDPWRSVGVTQNLGPSAQAIVIQGASQGNDLGPSTDADSAALTAAKTRIGEIIRGWVNATAPIAV